MDAKAREKFDGKGAGAVILTSGCKGFFSNGLDYGDAMKNPRFFEDIFDPVLYRLLTFPLITIAAINGHAFAGGFALALACDFRVMTGGRGLLCMNEIAFGSPLTNSFAPLLRIRLPHPQHLRETALGKRWTQKEALSIGILDSIIDDTQPDGEGLLIKKAVELGEKEGVRCAAGSWGCIKDQLYHSLIESSQRKRGVLFPHQETAAFWGRVGDRKGLAKL